MKLKTQERQDRDRLKSVKELRDEKRDEISGLEGDLEEAREAFNTAHGDTPPGEGAKSDEHKAVMDVLGKIGEAKDAVADLDQEEARILGVLGESTPSPRGANGDGPSDIDGEQSTWNPRAITEGDPFKRLLEGNEDKSKAKLGTVILGQLADRDATARFLAAEVDDSTMVGATPSDRRGFVQPNLQRLSVLDLFPVGTTDALVVEYVQILSLPGSAAEWTETDLKAEESFTTRDAEAPARTIAGWIKTKRRSLRDVAGLEVLLRTLLPWDVRRRLQAQMIAGDGEGDNLLGILNIDGIGEPEAVAGDNRADTILRAITAVVLSDADPNFTGAHPLDWQDLLLMRENQAERTGAYLYGTPALPAAPTIWGTAIVANRAVPAGTPLVGDSMAAAVLVKEGVTVRVSDSDGDDFRRNRVTLLAEGEFAFPVYKPTSFALAPAPEES